MEMNWSLVSGASSNWKLPAEPCLGERYPVPQRRTSSGDGVGLPGGRSCPARGFYHVRLRASREWSCGQRRTESTATQCPNSEGRDSIVLFCSIATAVCTNRSIRHEWCCFSLNIARSWRAVPYFLIGGARVRKKSRKST